MYCINTEEGKLDISPQNYIFFFVINNKMKFFWENKLTDLFLHILCINTQIGGSSDIKETQKWNDISKKKNRGSLHRESGQTSGLLLELHFSLLVEKMVIVDIHIRC